ncbi:MAG TPA: hypothetical protein VNK43_02975 [Gemmatimonadales bacterium]|nr:hypothetical protein [Gemmatimonadales bacterium]
MASAISIAHERFVLAERLLHEIERRHGLPHPVERDFGPEAVDRFLAVYVPESVTGSPAPREVQFTFTSSLREALDHLGRRVPQASVGSGAAVYVHDLEPEGVSDEH